MSSIRTKLRQLIGDVLDLNTNLQERQVRAIEGLCDIIGADQGAASRWKSGPHDGSKPQLIDFHKDRRGPERDHVLSRWLDRVKNEYRGDFRGDRIVEHGLTMPQAFSAKTREQLLTHDEWDRSLTRGAGARDILGGYFRCTIWDGMSGIALYRVERGAPFGARDCHIMECFMREMRGLHEAGALGPIESRPKKLTDLRQSVLNLLCTGNSVKEIAHKLDMDDHRKAIADHVHELHTTFRVSSTPELLALFMRTRFGDEEIVLALKSAKSKGVSREHAPDNLPPRLRRFFETLRESEREGLICSAYAE